MGLRERAGKWHYKFFAAGQYWTGNTELGATERNRTAALMKEAAARKLVAQGKGDQLRIQVTPFGRAADAFIDWARGEYREKPNSWKRLRGSMTSLKVFFGRQPLHTITVGHVQNFMTWRRLCTECKGTGCDACDQTGQGVKEVSLRHDLHALSPLFRYGIAHGWCASNPVKEVKVPSDKDAVRIHVLSDLEERAYFQACEQLRDLHAARAAEAKRSTAHWSAKRAARNYQDLYDVGRIMIQQGPRPAEVMALRRADVQFESGDIRIVRGKSTAARRILHMTPETRTVLERRSAAPDSQWVFPGHKKGTHLVDVENAHKRVLKRARLGFVLYDLRHTFATRFAEATDGDVVALAKILGHSNLRTVMRYVHISEAHTRAAMARFAARRPQNAEHSEDTDEK